MAAEHDLELLDDYLSNRLDPQGRAAFEEKLKTDPGLKSELELQQQFIQGIKNARIAELKSLMNNVAIPSGSTTGTAMGTKVAAWAVVVGIVGTSLYFLLKDENTQEIKPVSTEQKQDSEIQSTPAEKKSNVEAHDDGPVVSEEPASSEHKAISSPQATTKKSAGKKSSKKPSLDVYDPTKENPETPAKETHDGVVMKEVTPSVAVEINSTDKRSFNYQFQAGKLILYGPFQKDLYEILEFFSEEKRTMFLFYKDHYYLLNDGTEEIRPLVPIKDQTLIRKLKESRNN